MTAANQQTNIERRKVFLKTSTEQKIKREIYYWTDRFIDDEWEKEPIKVLVKQYWIKGDGDSWIERISDESFDWDEKEKEVNENDLFEGIHYESEYHVWRILDQVGNRCDVKLDCEKVLATITTAEVVKMVLELKGMI